MRSSTGSPTTATSSSPATIAVTSTIRKVESTHYHAKGGASLVVGLLTRFGDNNGDRLAGVPTVEGVSRSANSGGTGVGVHEAAVVRILTPRPSTLFAISCACTRRRPS